MPLPPPSPAQRAEFTGRTRFAAVQRATEPPSAAILTTKLQRVGAADPGYRLKYQLWQDWIRRYAHTHGVVRFAGSIVADACARSPLRIEHRSRNGEWEEEDDPRFYGLFDNYRNPRQHTDELIRRHAWYYQTAGELAQVLRDGPRGLEWHVYSMAGVSFPHAVMGRYPAGALATVRDIPNGTLRDGTAWQVPVEFVTRCWIPDEEWPGLATSPMAASVEDLHRYAALARDSLRRIESAIMMNGILWTPGEAHIDTSPPLDDQGNPVAGPSKLEKDYYEIAGRRFGEGDSVGTVVPPMFHWDHEFGPPQWVKIGEALDANALAFRKEALEDFARGVNLPASLVVGGAGGNEGNHWSEWLVDERYFKVTIAPIMDRVCHLDLTETFLYPYLRIDGERNPYDYRVGYDPQPVIVRPDQSDIGLRLHLAGLLGDEATLEAANFDGHDLMTPPELERLLKILAAKAPAPPGAPGAPGAPGGGTPAVGPGNVAKTPPALPAGRVPAQGSAGPITVINVGGEAYAVEKLAHTAAPKTPEPVTRAQEALAKVLAIRAETGRALRDFNEYTFDEAITRAGGKLITKANRKPVDVRKRVAAAVDRAQALKPHMAAVGVSEAELLAGHFDANYKRWVAERLRAARSAEAAALRAAGINLADDLGVLPEAGPVKAADYLAHQLLGLAVSRLSAGPALSPPTGEVSGNVPMGIVRDALNITEGSADFTPPSAPDASADVFSTDGPSIPDVITSAISDYEPEVSYTWNWAFYGDPRTPFDPHEELGASAFTTTDRSGDPALINNNDWPDTDFYSPGDHNGCTCEWVPTLQPRYAHDPAREEFGDALAPLGRTQAQIDRALEAAGVTQ